jgi:hypothetical protein
MDAVGDAVNWSDVARPALTAAVAAFEHRKGQNMSTAIERLRASKQRADQQDNDWGARNGRTWAEGKAEYRWLRDLSVRRKNYPEEAPIRALKAVLFAFNDEREWSELDFEELFAIPRPDGVTEYVFFEGDPDSASPEYANAFVDAALGFFQEVRAEVERD